ncbi:hypothetical protein AVEN_133977-1 [Araneus ventricosus]|uniref:Uncharacterized protein n=1 Tax=Araneus ventricosus TaxID=182803 RepID=A0A4Y2N6V1_ARAVE|nr:hypothetical protein AVEN_227189-1 [Araneus ventricosus]GBN34584.1 hypothetical protein AVEN_64040-1 [Araneus ventricosus]GBN34590.1 hypothetical protein AVEN_66333-1 [Araneus ventricosus]GBN34622.1 hypothetical protein AVEN_133977-1 [Araneus ventricosus]
MSIHHPIESSKPYLLLLNPIHTILDSKRHICIFINPDDRLSEEGETFHYFCCSERPTNHHLFRFYAFFVEISPVGSSTFPQQIGRTLMGEHPSCNVIDCCRFDKRGSHDCGRREMSGGPSREKREREKKGKRREIGKGKKRRDVSGKMIIFVFLVLCYSLQTSRQFLEGKNHAFVRKLFISE